MESQKYKLGGSNDVVGPDGSALSTVYAKGSNLALEPLDYGDTSLVGLWSFNEGTGTVAYDYSGNNATGSWNGTPAGTSGYYSAGKIGPWAGAFDGASTYVNDPTSLLSITNALTMAAWVKLSVVYSSMTAAYPGPSGKSLSFVFFGYGSVGGGGNLQYFYIDDTSNARHTVNSNSAIDTNWHFVVGTYDGSTQKLYIDGVLQNSTASWSSSIYTSGIPFRIGEGDISPSQFFPGLIDDVRIYNRALSAGEIAAIYAGGK